MALTFEKKTCLQFLILGLAFPDPVQALTRLVKDLGHQLDPAQELPPEMVSEDLVGVRLLPMHRRPPSIPVDSEFPLRTRTPTA